MNNIRTDVDQVLNNFVIYAKPADQDTLDKTLFTWLRKVS